MRWWLFCGTVLVDTRIPGGLILLIFVLVVQVEGWIYEPVVSSTTSIVAARCRRHQIFSEVRRFITGVHVCP